jgi:hypothetical protein
MKFNFFEFLKARDIFGKPITLTHNGSETFQTIHGAVISIAFLIYLAVFSIQMLLPVIYGQIDSSSSKRAFSDVNNAWFDPFATGFKFAFGFPNFIDPEVASVSLSYVKAQWVDS